MTRRPTRKRVKNATTKEKMLEPMNQVIGGDVFNFPLIILQG